MFSIDDYLYISLGDRGIEIVDISNPQYPIQVSIQQLIHNIEKFYLHSNLVYATTYDSIILALDVNDPANPAVISQYDCGNYPVNGLAFYDTLCFIANGENGILKLDNSDPNDLTFISQFDPGFIVDNLYLKDSYLLASNAYTGVTLIDIIDPANPEVCGSFNSPGSAEEILTIGDDYLLNDHSSLILLHQTITDIKPQTQIPTAFSLSPNYPNPFNAATTISYSLPSQSEVRLDIYDILGRRVRSLDKGRHGRH